MHGHLNVKIVLDLYQTISRCVRLTTLPPSCADCLDVWEPQPPEPSGPVQACNGIALPHYHTVKTHLWKKQDRKCTYNVTLRFVCATIATVEKQ